MLPIKIENGVASLIVNSSRKLTPRQLATLRRTEARDGGQAAQRYLCSLLGLSKGRVDVSRYRSSPYGRDALANKPKGRFAQMFRDLQDNDEDVNHRPTQRSIGQWVGVEIECYYPAEKQCSEDCNHDEDECYGSFEPDAETCRQRIRNALIKAGVARASVKDDGSLENDEGAAVEVTLLFNTEDGYSQLEKTCKVLNDLGCFVDKKCGLHVHLDGRHLRPAKARIIGQRLGRALPVLKYIVDPSRHNNRYCEMEVGPYQSDHEARYYAVNLQAHTRYKTIEVRMHGGSTNARKIRSWIELLRFIASTRMPKTLNTFQDLIDLGTPEHLVEYADKRITRLNPGAWDILAPVPPPPVETPSPAEVESLETRLERAERVYNQLAAEREQRLQQNLDALRGRADE